MTALSKSLIFLDDERNLEDVTWIKYPEYGSVHIVRRECDFIFIVSNIDKETFKYYDFSFDHDIQDFTEYGENTGYTCAKWLCEYVMDNELTFDNEFYIHTKNPVGGENIRSYLNNFKDFMNR